MNKSFCIELMDGHTAHVDGVIIKDNKIVRSKEYDLVLWIVGDSDNKLLNSSMFKHKKVLAVEAMQPLHIT